MTRNEFMDLVYDELSNDSDNYRANRIIDAADEYANPKKGKWIHINPLVDTLVCSECGWNILNEEFITDFCPDCGAYMRKTKIDHKFDSDDSV